MLFENPNAGAIFSPCRMYRYRLWRVWDDSKPSVAFCMLNPSTADEEVLDPTITRCVGFAKSWGYGRLEIVNLFALRSTDPELLYTHESPMGDNADQNYNSIQTALFECDKMICAWGVHGAFLERGKYVKEKLFKDEKVYHLGLTKKGFPKHPLYLKAGLKPILWE